MGNLRPTGRCHITGVDGGIELIGVDLCIKLLQFGHVDDEMLEIEGLEGTCLRVAVHADGAASIDK